MADNQRQPHKRYADHLQEAARWAADKTQDDLHRMILDWLEGLQPHYSVRHSLQVELPPALFMPALAEIMLSDPDEPLVITREARFARLGLGAMIRLSRNSDNPGGPLIVLRPEEPVLSIQTLGALHIQRPSPHPVAALLPSERLVLGDVNCIYYPIEPVSDIERAYSESYMSHAGLTGLTPYTPGGGKLLPGLIRFKVTPSHLTNHYLIEAMCNPLPDLEADPKPLTEYFEGLVDRVQASIEGIARRLAFVTPAIAVAPTSQLEKRPARAGRPPDHPLTDWEKWVQGWFQAEADGQLKDDYIAKINVELRKAGRPEITRPNFATVQKNLTRSGRVSRYEVDTCSNLTA